MSFFFFWLESEHLSYAPGLVTLVTSDSLELWYGRCSRLERAIIINWHSWVSLSLQEFSLSSVPLDIHIVVLWLLWCYSRVSSGILKRKYRHSVKNYATAAYEWCMFFGVSMFRAKEHYDSLKLHFLLSFLSWKLLPIPRSFLHSLLQSLSQVMVGWPRVVKMQACLFAKPLDMICK